jgi:hypothetical protein
MKKLFLIYSISLLPLTLAACDFCNCYLGLDPGFNKNTIGLRFNYKLSTIDLPELAGLKLAHGGADAEGMTTLYQRSLGTELYARIYPTPKLQLMAILPFQYNTIEFGSHNETGEGPGDLVILGYYQIYNTMPADSDQVRHRIFGGLGAKFPTGKSSGASDINIPFAYDLYEGTGSTDYIVAASYIGKKNQLGWRLDANYKINGESSNEYRFGNSVNTTAQIFYEKKLKSISIIPHAGASLENGSKDEYLGKSQEETGGSVLWGSAGADLYVRKFSVTTDLRLPFSHNTSELLPESKYWFFTSLNFHF